MRYVTLFSLNVVFLTVSTCGLKQIANVLQTQLTSEAQSIVREPRRRTSLWP